MWFRFKWWSWAGSATLTLDTGSSHFTTAVNNLGGGNTTSLNKHMQSNDINITNIHSTTESLEQRVGQIESNTGSYDDLTVIHHLTHILHQMIQLIQLKIQD